MDDLTVIVYDKNGKKLDLIDSKKAKKIVKSKKAKYLNDNAICLFNDIKKESTIENKKGLNKIKIPKYTLGEEITNAITHGIGAFLSIAALILCIVFSAIKKDPYSIVASSIYGATSIILYTMSTIYHSLKINKAKKVFRIIDHCSIYLLIAGTYTPYSLITLRNANTALGWSVFGIIWGCAIIGIVFTSIDMNKFKKIETFLYIAMGWMIIFTFKTLLDSLNIKAIYLMIIAGILYTIGAVFYKFGKKKKYIHSLFHLFVLAASILFFFSILLYVI